jgi:hypothetical protein
MVRVLYDSIQYHKGRNDYGITGSNNIVTVRLLNEEGKYGIPAIYEGKGMLSMDTLEELEINLDLMFRE